MTVAWVGSGQLPTRCHAPRTDRVLAVEWRSAEVPAVQTLLFPRGPWGWLLARSVGTVERGTPTQADQKVCGSSRRFLPVFRLTWGLLRLRKQGPQEEGVGWEHVHRTRRGRTLNPRCGEMSVQRCTGCFSPGE